MAYWIKIHDQGGKQVHVIDLDRVSSFSLYKHNRLTIYWHHSEQPLVLTAQSDPRAYEQVLRYVEKTTGYSLETGSTE
ncbi:hypothetical protein [Sodalinema gerasimenkoae]|uniref:hypothetical protein n=1 Tax=Sodalinema gerasimenkoae TaxID=2862348 RepID=UPI00135A7C73|nr:hypothetical protein [Sodalinema gerasimenkoae]